MCYASMQFNVPQFIDKEDKIVGPFTAKQLGWLAGAAAVMFLLWAFLDITAFIIASVPVVGIFGAFAFYHPNGQPFISFIGSTIKFATRPKIYAWRRLPEKRIAPKKAPAKAAARIMKKDINERKIEDISNLLDSKL